MHRRTLLSGAATLAAAGIAGCSDDDPAGGGNGNGTETPDATPAPADDVGWRDGDELNVEELTRTHAEALVGAGSFRVFSEADTEHSGEERPGDWLFSQTYESRFEADRERQFLEQDLTEVAETTTAYVADGMAYYRLESEDGTRYQTEAVERTPEEFQGAMQGEALTGVRGLEQWNMQVDGATTHEGREVTRFTADEFEGDRGIPTETTEAEATVLIDGDGIVRHIEQTWVGTHEEQDVTVTVTIDFLDVGETTVDEPAWVEEARAQDDDGDDGTDDDGENDDDGDDTDQLRGDGLGL